MINYDDLISDKMKDIKFSGIRKFFDIANSMEGIISLGVGEPDFPTPWAVRDYAIKKIQKGITQYTSNSGLMELRKNVCRYLSERYSLEYAPEDVLTTVGASEPIDLACRILLNPGDEVLVPSPSYVSYLPCIKLADGVAVPVQCREEDNFKLRAEALKAAITPRTKALIFPYPNNPTGAVMRREDILPLLPIIEENNLVVISDEIYSELTYNDMHVSIASFEGMREGTIYINGFSKSFAMTGWRVGYVAAPQPLLKQMLKIHQYTTLCAPIMGQFAAYYALEQGLADDFSSITEMRAEYDLRRKYVVKRFNDMGLTCFNAEGAFYVFPCVARTGMDGDAFADRLLMEGGVAVVPGSAFSDDTRDYIRVSYAYSMKMLRKALDKIEAFLSSLKIDR